MGKKRTLNRMDYRGDFEEEGAEAKPAAEDEEESEEEESEEEEEAEGEAEAEPDEEAGDEEEAPKPVKKKKKIVAPVKAKRTRTPKLVRKKAVWRIFDNSSKLIETFDYSQRAEAEAFLQQKNTDKKGAFYIQLIKIEIEEKEKPKEPEKAKSKK